MEQYLYTFEENVFSIQSSKLSKTVHQIWSRIKTCSDRQILKKKKKVLMFFLGKRLGNEFQQNMEVKQKRHQL